MCGNNLNIVSMCAVSPVVHTSNISSCQKKKISFLVAVNNSIKVGPLVFLLSLFVNKEIITKRPIFTSPLDTSRSLHFTIAVPANGLLSPNKLEAKQICCNPTTYVHSVGFW